MTYEWPRHQAFSVVVNGYLGKLAASEASSGHISGCKGNAVFQADQTMFTARRRPDQNGEQYTWTTIPARSRSTSVVLTLHWFLLHCPSLLPKQFTDSVFRLSCFIMLLCHCGISSCVCYLVFSSIPTDQDYCYRPSKTVCRRCDCEVNYCYISDVIISYCVYEILDIPYNVVCLHILTQGQRCWRFCRSFLCYA